MLGKKKNPNPETLAEAYFQNLEAVQEIESQLETLRDGLHSADNPQQALDELAALRAQSEELENQAGVIRKQLVAAVGDELVGQLAGIDKEEARADADAGDILQRAGQALAYLKWSLPALQAARPGCAEQIQKFGRALTAFINGTSDASLGPNVVSHKFDMPGTMATAFAAEADQLHGAELQLDQIRSRFDDLKVLRGLKVNPGMIPDIAQKRASRLLNQMAAERGFTRTPRRPAR